jgi:hypothetical protein
LGLSCPTASTCFASGTGISPSGGSMMATTNSGSIWTAQSIPVGDYPYGISCPTTSVCYAATADSDDAGTSTIMASTDSGAVWSDQTIPSGTIGLGSISCVTTANCYTVGGSTAQRVPGTVIETSDSGTTWATQPLPSGTGQLSGVSCPSSAGCFAVGDGALGAGGLPTGGLILSNEQGSLAVTTTSLTNATRGVSYSYSLSALGGQSPYKWKKTSALPKGLRLSRTGVISGTPSAKLASGPYLIAVQVTDSAKKATKQTANATLTLTLN